MKNMDVFLLIGQSNMAGRGRGGEVPPIDDPDILMFRGGEWVKAVEPLHQDKPSAGVGLAMSFAAHLRQSAPGTRIGLIPAAVGGTPLSRWQKDGDLYERAVAVAHDAIKNGTLGGILWHQGENDALRMEDASSYLERFTAMVADLRMDLSAGNVPFVAGELGGFLARNDSIPHHALVNAALKSAGEAIPRYHFVSSDGLADTGDVLHFSSAALREFGRRYAHAYRALAGAGGSQKRN